MNNRRKKTTRCWGHWPFLVLARQPTHNYMRMRLNTRMIDVNRVKTIDDIKCTQPKSEFTLSNLLLQVVEIIIQCWVPVALLRYVNYVNVPYNINGHTYNIWDLIYQKITYMNQSYKIRWYLYMVFRKWKMSLTNNYLYYMFFCSPFNQIKTMSCYKQ